MSVDPLAEKYAYNGVYNFSENRVLDARELEGLESILLIDINERPQDNGTKEKTYSGKMYYRNDTTGDIKGPYEASSYPNSNSNSDNSTKYNTIQDGLHNYNNLSGHKGGLKKGLNIDDFGNRKTLGTKPNGDDVLMQYVNVHEGASDNGNYNSRGSAGCITINPKDSKDFFANFSWTNKSKTTGNSSGTIDINRGSSLDNSIKLIQFQIDAANIKLNNFRIEILQQTINTQ